MEKNLTITEQSQAFFMNNVFNGYNSYLLISFQKVQIGRDILERLLGSDFMYLINGIESICKGLPKNISKKKLDLICNGIYYMTDLSDLLTYEEIEELKLHPEYFTIVKDFLIGIFEELGLKIFTNVISNFYGEGFRLFVKNL